MTWDPQWEKVFTSRAWGVYPPEELIRFTARHYYGTADRSAVRILELGCGPGPIVWYLAREGFTVSGIDGSPTAIAQARDRLIAEGLTADLRVGDFLELRSFYRPTYFDAILDITSLQHNRYSAIERTIENAYQALRPGGRFFGLMLAEGSWGFGAGQEVEAGTFSGVEEGPLTGMGVTHFFTEAELRSLLAPFHDVSIDYSVRTLCSQSHWYKHWLVEARRPG